MGWIWVAKGLKDGPLPAHYEPFESPLRNAVYAQQVNPPADPKERDDNPYADSPVGDDYPCVLTTYRLTEHHTAGGMDLLFERRGQAVRVDPLRRKGDVELVVEPPQPA